MTDDSAEKIIDLEQRIAFQEDAIKALNETLFEQQKRIDELVVSNRYLFDRIKGTDSFDSGGSEEESQPPHY